MCEGLSRKVVQVMQVMQVVQVVQVSAHTGPN